ncbi:peroxidase [Rhodobacterales bacterium HKCCE2091]|nr:peroxidase [Rhodobacterales bacterium HKCCE2091]
MLFSLGHGGHIVTDTAPAPESLATEGHSPTSPVESVVDGETAETALLSATRFGTETAPAATTAATAGGAFRYFFHDADGFPTSATMLAALDELAESMVEGGPVPPFASLPPILTYFGQFIDHDITANTDREVIGISEIDGDFGPMDRDDVIAQVDNLRDGSLGLDSLYGDSVGQGPFAQKLAGLMRHPTLTKKMRLGVSSATAEGPPAKPGDPATDLLRLGFLLDRGALTVAELQALDPALRGNFLEADGVTPIRQRAIVGDGRNDENLVVAQLQVAFLRFHNKLVDLCDSFTEARRLTRYHYQWFVAHDYLPSLCDNAVLDELLQKGSPLYSGFFGDHGPSMPTKMPMPLEFSVAGFRFGHSMVRESYDHNSVFGKAEPGKPNLIPDAAPFDLLFAFTGNGRMAGTGSTQLPDNWVIDWARFVHAETPERSARAIDTKLAPPLGNMLNEPSGVFKHLAKRNLRRGYRLNLPSAQACIDAINASGHFRHVDTLTPAQVMDGRTIAGADFGTTTPLWFYVLREAELVGGGHLGPLGTHIVAGTILGLIVKDPSSYWNDTTAGHRWSPYGFRPSDPIDSLKAMLRFTGQL